MEDKLDYLLALMLANLKATTQVIVNTTTNKDTIKEWVDFCERTEEIVFNKINEK